MKLGVLSVSTPELKPEEAVVAYAAAGLKGVGWRTTEDKGDRTKPTFWNGNRTSMTPEEVIERAVELKHLCIAQGLEMPCLGTYIDSLHPEKVAQGLQAARAVGASSIRVNPTGYPREDKSYCDLMHETREQFQGLAGFVREYGVKVLIETHHGYLAPSVSKAMQVLDGLSPSEFGIIWDPCNQLNEGLERYRMAVDIAGPYLAEVHVKNLFYEMNQAGVWQTKYCPLDRGIVRWVSVVDELKNVGYDGWLMLEDFYTDLPVHERLEQGCRYMQALLRP